MAELLVVVLLLGSIGLYFLPTIVGITRKKTNLTAIVLLNLLLGWTLIGWVVALVWALSTQVVDLMPTASAASRSCPFCAESIQAAAVICRHCGRDLPPRPAPAPLPPPRPVADTKRSDAVIRWGAAIGVLLVVGVVIALAVISYLIRIPTVSDEPQGGPSAMSLYEQYDSNSVSADQAFKGRRIMVNGLVSGIGTELLGRPYITFAVPGHTTGVQAIFEATSAVASISKGDYVYAICTVDGMLLRTVQLSKCVPHAP